jgi:hypothetical protein
MNIKNGLQVLVLATVVILALVLCMTLLSATDHAVPAAFPEALIALIGGLAGAGAVHLSARVNGSKDGPSGPSPPV